MSRTSMCDIPRRGSPNITFNPNFTFKHMPLQEPCFWKTIRATLYPLNCNDPYAKKKRRVHRLQDGPHETFIKGLCHSIAPWDKANFFFSPEILVNCMQSVLFVFFYTAQVLHITGRCSNCLWNNTFLMQPTKHTTLPRHWTVTIRKTINLCFHILFTICTITNV